MRRDGEAKGCGTTGWEHSGAIAQMDRATVS